MGKIQKLDTKKKKDVYKTSEIINYYHESGFFIKKLRSQINQVPLFCPVCTFTMTHPNDNLSFKTYECCQDCQLTWTERNREKWSAGWRPKLSEVKKLKNVMNRISISLNLENN